VTGPEGRATLCVFLGPCKVALNLAEGPFEQASFEELAPFQADLQPDFFLEFVTSPPSACAGLHDDSSRSSGAVLVAHYSLWFAQLDLSARRGQVFAPNAAVAGKFLRTAAQILPLVTRTGVALHAACVAIDGRAVVIAASSGTGKTTAALRMLGPRAELLADDITLISGLEERRPVVRTAPIEGGDGAPRGPKAAPLARVYGLRRAAVDGVVPLQPGEAMAVLRRNIAIGTRQPGLVLEGLRCARALLETTPIRRLDCTPDGPVLDVVRRDLAAEPPNPTEAV
jgi:hypothetical protein